jgi:hypothetical protein
VGELILSHAGLTRVSIFQMMDCRIKSGNDGLASEQTKGRHQNA